MNAFQERVIAEREELDHKLASLTDFFTSKVYANLPVAEQVRLSAQATAMGIYSDILGQRIAAFTP